MVYRFGQRQEDHTIERRLAELPQGARISDYISLGVIARTFPADKIDAVLAATGETSVRQRELPAHVVVCYVIAPAQVHAVVLSGSAVLLAGRVAVAARTGNEGESGGQLGDLAGTVAAGGAGAAATP